MALAHWRSLSMSPSQLSLAHVLKSGQSFRWTLTRLAPPEKVSQDIDLATEEYSLCLSDRLVVLRQTATQLYYQAIFPASSASAAFTTDPKLDRTTIEWIKKYFQLDVDLVQLESDWAARDQVYSKGKQVGTLLPGVRVLNQDPWECLFGFICSSNNNIARITSMVQSAAHHFSPPLLTYQPPPSSQVTGGAIAAAASDMTVSANPKAYHPFPPPSSFTDASTVPTLLSLGFGYRSKFIHQTARLLVESHSDPQKYLESLRALPTDKAREALLEFTGVGPKVADCVLLMSLGKKEVVPLDVHVVGFAERLYGLRTGGKGKGMTKSVYGITQSKLREVWGDWAGWTQAVLFASDLPFLMSSIANPTTRPIKPVKIKVLPKIESSESSIITSFSVEAKGELTLEGVLASERINKRETVERIGQGESKPSSLELEAESMGDRIKRRRRGEL
ncbi:8-oxoguanine DNA glycosylase [Phaffia rhodozyma]|uniref:DNA-(apurinic or apyrimidinic site) lyase n=1 Tax=Phaffia rhodozyma TaxID=264483 RepID=A0A0F7SJN7_PHARH|nr:8-oxoguanine DNA glycosylase [Phaffia rhodozyma]